jgi:hypothetical protein
MLEPRPSCKLTHTAFKNQYFALRRGEKTITYSQRHLSHQFLQVHPIATKAIVSASKPPSFPTTDFSSFNFDTPHRERVPYDVPSLPSNPFEPYHVQTSDLVAANREFESANDRADPVLACKAVNLLQHTLALTSMLSGAFRDRLTPRALDGSWRRGRLAASLSGGALVRELETSWSSIIALIMVQKASAAARKNIRYAGIASRGVRKHPDLRSPRRPADCRQTLTLKVTEI